MTLTEAEMIAKYDAERNGTLYVKPAAGTDVTDAMIAALEAAERRILPACPDCGCPYLRGAAFCDNCGRAQPSSTAAWSAIQAITDDPADDGLTADESQVLDVVIVRSRDAQHRQQRLDAILDYILDAPEAEQNRLLEIMESLNRRFDATHTAPLNG